MQCAVQEAGIAHLRTGGSSGVLGENTALAPEVELVGAAQDLVLSARCRIWGERRDFVQ